MDDLRLGCDSGKVGLLSLLDLSAAFDTIDHEILFKRLQSTFGIRGVVLEWFKSFVKNRLQTVTVNGNKSSANTLNFGVPQGSVLGPILFTLYTQPLVNVIRKFNLKFHFYADDTQLYDLCMRQNIDDLFDRMAKCINAVKLWMSRNRLMLNDDKTEAMVVGSPRSLKDINAKHITIGENKIQLSNKLRNLGVQFDCDLSCSSHVSYLVQTMYFQLRRISKISHIFDKEHVNLLVCSLVFSKLDYCNSLLAGLSFENLNKIQIVQNNAARLVLKKSKRDSASQLLKNLHWLPVEKRIYYKIATLCHKCIHDTAPEYLANKLTFYKPNRVLRSSSDDKLFDVPKIHLKTFGERSFSSCGPKLWNSLPKELRNIESLDTFKGHLKTFLFKL